MGSDLQRSCARRTCPLDARPKGKLCRDHHAAAMREWRKVRGSAGLPIAGATRTAPSSSPAAVLARVYLHRKRVEPEPCAACGQRDDVVAAHIDPSEPEAITWACRGCRYDLLIGLRQRREDEALQDALSRQRREAEERERVAVEQLAAAIAARRTAIEDSQMFRQRLAFLAERHFALNTAND